MHQQPELGYLVDVFAVGFEIVNGSVVRYSSIERTSIEPKLGREAFAFN